MLEKDSLQRAVHAQLGKVRRRIAKRQSDLDEARHARDYRNMGELVLANRGQIRRGATEITVPNWYQAGAQTTIPLQPDLGPVENAQWYFKRWKKGHKASEILLLLLRRDAQEEEWLANLEESIAQADAPEEIPPLAELLATRGYRSQRLVSHASAAQRATRWPKGVRVYEDFAGFRVLVGTGAHGNETLLRELSSPDDIWLHTRGARGAHAIIKTNRHPERVPTQVIEKVAALTAHFSEERGAATVAVDYTLRKYVRKIKGGAPGLVRYERGKTLLVAPLASPPASPTMGTPHPV